MNHAETLPQDGFSVSGVEYRRLRLTIDAVLDGIPAGERAALVSKYLLDTAEREARQLARMPGVLRTILQSRGKELVVRLLKQNWEHLGNSTSISDLFSIPTSTLHRLRDKNRVIFYQFDLGGEGRAASEIVFPLEQFEKGSAKPWAADVVKALGNGAPSIHFLYATRAALEDRSFAEALRDATGEDLQDVEQLLVKTARQVAAE